MRVMGVSAVEGGEGLGASAIGQLPEEGAGNDAREHSKSGRSGARDLATTHLSV